MWYHKDFRFWCQKVLPLVYDDSLSYYEVLCKLTDYINNIIKDEASLSEEVLNLKEYVENLETNIEQVVNNTITELFQSGDLDPTLEQMIKEAVEPIYEKYKTNWCAIGRLGRLLDDGRYGSRKLYSQSVTYDGTNFYSCGGYNSNANQCITKFNSVGELSGYADFTALGHANDICYLEDKLYVANGGGNTVGVVDATTLTLETVLEFSGYSNVYGITTDGTVLYVLAVYNGFSYVCRVDGDSLLRLFGVTYYSGNVKQGCCYFNGNIYVVSNVPNKLSEYNAESGELTGIYYIPESDGYFPVGEIESALVVNNALCVGCTSYMAESMSAFYNKFDHWFSQIFTTSIYNENVSGGRQITEPSRLSLTVNGNASTSFNPMVDFTTVEEATLLLTAHGGGFVSISNVNDGCAVLINGTYGIIGSSGDRHLSAFMCSDADVIASQLNIDEYVSFHTCKAHLKSCVLTGDVVIDWSDVKLTDCDLSNLNGLTHRRSDIDIDNLRNDLDSATTFTMSEAKSGTFNMKSRYREYALKMAASYGSGVLFEFIMPSIDNKAHIMYLTNSQMSTDGTYTIDDDTIVGLKIESGIAYAVKNDETELQLSEQTTYCLISGM